jgi:two-component system, NtrC family, sensor kinase
MNPQQPPCGDCAFQEQLEDLRRANGSLTELNLQLQRAQDQLVQSEKLASIGQLAAGVAHEINNPVGYVFSNFGTLSKYLEELFRMLAAYEEAEPLLAGTPAGVRLAALRQEIELDYLKEDVPQLMNESRDGITRVRKIVQDLKDFSHVDARREWEWADLHRGIDSTLNIVNNEIKYKADVLKVYAELPQVQCLSSELNQVFMNLLVNAAHAIPGGEQGRGTIHVRTGVESEQVWVEIEDNGVGIAKENLGRVFDPFFTTKPVGQGTGLGLSLSYGIVKKHHGRLEVDSEPGRGTRFRVTVPVRQPEQAAA